MGALVELLTDGHVETNFLSPPLCILSLISIREMGADGKSVDKRARANEGISVM